MELQEDKHYTQGELSEDLTMEVPDGYVFVVSFPPPELGSVQVYGDYDSAFFALADGNREGEDGTLVYTRIMRMP